MKRETLIDGLVFVGLISAGAAARIWFRELPNFAPIAAMALFAGYYFRSAWLALAVPLLAMLASDAVIGGYDWKLMAVVYGMLALPVAFGGPLKAWARIEQGHLPAALTTVGGLIGISLLSSVLFFLTTNLACWYWGEIYEPTTAGLIRCYANALPFFRHTLAGDLTFALVLFGSYAAAINFGWLTRPAEVRLAGVKA